MKLKKSIYILFLLILALQSGGLFLFFKLQQYSVKYNMQQKVDNSESCFEQLTLSYSDYIKSIVDDNEICFQGKMYDIKSMNFKNDSVCLVAINDIEEEDILKKIKKIFASDQSQKNKIPDSVIQLLSLDYILQPGILNHNVTSFSISVKHSYSENIIKQKSDIILPPPELA